MAQNLLYLDPWSGISGDMILAALLDAGRAGGWRRRLHGAVRVAGPRRASRWTIKHETEWGHRLHPGGRAGRAGPAAAPSGDMLEVIGAGGRVGAGEGSGAGGGRGGWPRSRRVSTAAPVDEIHFHEVGAVDTLVDVVGTFVLVEALGVDKVFVGHHPGGRRHRGDRARADGSAGAGHGGAAGRLSRSSAGPEMRELTTPTGALLVGQLGASRARCRR